ncbi:MAG: MotA/TolQ/ExbB proton channel family protein [Gemmatimonadota bacterium]|nr:MotA/TolQ/ExbB proton channel family protein [Gemmatimonadota bacterium]
MLPLIQAIPTTPVELLTGSSLSTKIVLGILIVLSLVSWAIIVAKSLQFRRVTAAGERFSDEFVRVKTMEQAGSAVGRAGGPHAVLMDRAMRFIQETTPAISGSPDRSARFSASQVESLRLVLDSETTTERDRLSRSVPWLATIGSVSPLIGLLGTVLGVIEAFVGIASKGSGNLGAVAPGVAEALIATAAALTVAIPAVFAYNLFANRLNKIEGELESFGSELIALMVREDRI